VPLYTSAAGRALDALTDSIAVALKNGGWPSIIATHLLYDFDGGQVLPGPSGEVDPIATATTKIERAHPFLLLFTTALLDGRCGSPGIAAYMD